MSENSKKIKVMHDRNMQHMTMAQRLLKPLMTAGTYLFLSVMALIVLFPFYWMIISSLKTLAEYQLNIPTFWPKEIMLSNYTEAFSTGNLGRLFFNTAYVGIVSTILSLVITILTAFALARLEFKGKNALFAALLATMMIPGELFTITNYQTVNTFNWMNTYTVLIVPFLVSVFYIYLLRQNFLQIPNELYLAAKVDGTSDLKYLWKVMVPLALPTLISITILKMMGAWNSYIWPRLVANDEARSSQRLHRHQRRRQLPRADGSRRACLCSPVPGLRLPAQVHHEWCQPQRHQGLKGSAPLTIRFLNIRKEGNP